VPKVGRRRVLLAGAGITGVLLAGCSGDGGEDDPADRGPIEIRQLAFAAGRPAGYDEYEDQPGATYGRGDVVWLYADYEGLSGEPIEPESEEESGDQDGASGGNDTRQDDEPTRVDIDLQQSLSVTHLDDGPIVEDEATFQETLAVPQLDRYFTGTEILLPGDVGTGEYETTVTVTDRVSETEDSATATFRIEN
jgi:hypothetical protein